MQELDKRILNFIDEFRAASTKHIQRVFYKSQSQAQFLTERKMRKLYKKKLIKRYRYSLNEPYIYYFKKSGQITHHLIVTELYCKLMEHEGELIGFEIEKEIEDIRPDAVCQYKYRSDKYTFCFEIHRSNNKFDQAKYERLYKTGVWKRYFSVFPIIVIVSDRKIRLDESKLIYIQVDTELQNIDKIFI